MAQQRKNAPFLCKVIQFSRLEILLHMIFVMESSGWQVEKKSCDQVYYTESSEPLASLNINITKQVRVRSIIECGQLCGSHDFCEAFLHSINKKDGNCRMLNGTPERKMGLIKHVVEEKWRLYISLKAKCEMDKTCQGQGQCMTDCNQPDVVKCGCYENYYGEYCEKYYDYDLNFPNTSAYTQIDVGHIDKSLNEFTITVWVLFNVGYESYPLISYKTKNSSQNIAMHFDLDGNGASTIASLTAKAFNKSLSMVTIPINDDHWHHVGFTWSGVTGIIMLLIDGVLWATRNVSMSSEIPSGGKLTIGEKKAEGGNQYLVGKISRMNMWSRALDGKKIEMMAKSPGINDGDLITWYKLKNIVSTERIIRPSKASFSEYSDYTSWDVASDVTMISLTERNIIGLKCEITLKLRQKCILSYVLGNETNYYISVPSTLVSYPGPPHPINYISACVWYYGSGSENHEIFSYNSSKEFRFQFKSGTQLFTKINGVSSQKQVPSSFKKWHFLCLKWNGKKAWVKYFFDGFQVDTSVNDSALQITLPERKNFVVPLSSNGKIFSQLNIWDHEISSSNIQVMVSGGLNIHGNVLAWSKLLPYVSPGDIKLPVTIYLPGYTVLTKRTKWCRDNLSGSSCPGEEVARLGGMISRESIFWQCYCPKCLTASKNTFDFDTTHTSKTCYVSKVHHQLIHIN
ncbi:uncharacterized protein LOC124433269 [Xenia sp. Carnegie-2017]|uniref:uncharacterized protein LOC124433269 n=1 Tax=Xenia sp. Carnegie-2017 TaxID=2897299 RepID=UPI001F03329C|nr:uncharacterized protein LOC124433269 [Xenia sp. Carnegie-2017]